MAFVMLQTNGFFFMLNQRFFDVKEKAVFGDVKNQCFFFMLNQRFFLILHYKFVCDVKH